MQPKDNHWSYDPKELRRSQLLRAALDVVRRLCIIERVTPRDIFVEKKWDHLRLLAYHLTRGIAEASMSEIADVFGKRKATIVGGIHRVDYLLAKRRGKVWNTFVTFMTMAEFEYENTCQDQQD